MSTAEICSSLSSFVEIRNEDQILDLSFNDNVNKCMADIYYMNEDITKAANDFNLHYDLKLSYTFAKPVYMWVNGKTIKEVFETCSLDMYEGNFVRGILRINSIHMVNQ